MALRYEITVDVSSLPIIGNESVPGLAMWVDDTGAGAEITYASGLFSHSDISTVDSDFSEFATQLQTDLNAAGGLNGTFTVTWNGATGYTIASTLAFIVEWSGANVTTDEHGTNLRRLLGYSANLGSATSHSSDVRPFYVAIPAAQGRTEYSRDHGRPDFAQDAEADDGTSVFIAKSGAAKIGDWLQVGEIEPTPATFSDAGTPTHKDMVDAGTSANDVPWSWEHFLEHAATAKHRVSVFEGSDHEVWELRADGMWFDAQRWAVAGPDQPLWQVPLRCRLIGRV